MAGMDGTKVNSGIIIFFLAIVILSSAKVTAAKEKSSGCYTKKTNRNDSAIKSTTIDIELLWKSEDPKFDMIYPLIYSDDDNIFLFDTETNSLLCVGSKNGKRSWYIETGGTKFHLFLKSCLVCVYENKITFLNKLTGGTIKDQILKDKVFFDCVISKEDTILFYDTQDIKYIRKIVAINLNTGKTLWEKPIEGIVDKSEANRPSNIYSYKEIGKRLFVGANGSFLILDPTNGKVLKWYDTLSSCSFLYEPAVDKQGNIYSASTLLVPYQPMTSGLLARITEKFDKFSLIKLDHNLKKVWEKEISPSVSSPLIADNRVFLVTMNADDCINPPKSGLRRPVLSCYNKDTGKKIWEYKFKRGNSYWEYFMGRNQLEFYEKVVIYCHSYDGVHIFDAENGKLLKRIYIGEHKYLSDITVYTPPPYCSTFNNGVIYLLGCFSDSKPEDLTHKDDRQILGAFKIVFDVEKTGTSEKNYEPARISKKKNQADSQGL